MLQNQALQVYYSEDNLCCCRVSTPVEVVRPPVIDMEDLINLRICILRDWDIEVLSRSGKSDSSEGSRPFKVWKKDGGEV